MQRELSVKDIFWFWCEQRNMFQSLVRSPFFSDLVPLCPCPPVGGAMLVICPACVLVLRVTENALQHSSK